LRITGPRITARGSLQPEPDEEVVDLGGALLMPGLVNAHTHLYSTLARGMPAPRVLPMNFTEILENVWWPLDRALNKSSVRLSALTGGIDAALSGTTLLIDHHSSPSFITGSLSCIRDALEQVGLRSCLCYEVTDRNGPEGTRLGIEENLAFRRDHQTELTRSMIGGHASLTLSESTLNALADAISQSGSSLHIHVAEDLADVDDCRQRYGLTLRERLEHHGLIQSRAILAHCVHLTQGEIGDVHGLGGWIAHNPRSNMNNAVGQAPAQSMKRAALGTDGVDQDMLAELRACCMKLREAKVPGASAVAMQLLVGGHRLAAALFGLPFGKLDVGAPADIIALDYVSPTPVRPDNIADHMMFGISRANVESVMVAGRWVVRERRVCNVDAKKTNARAQTVAGALWKRISRAS
jgi:putative selenium metabolism protein SsnA